MDRLMSLKNKLAKREQVFGFISVLHDQNVLPGYSRDGVDFILYDLEHGAANIEQISDLLPKCRALDIPTIVRVQDALYHLIAKPIDLGADGIMLPRTETIKQVETAIGAMRFAPLGRKGCGGSYQFRDKESFAQFQENRLLFLQIESSAGVVSLPEILARYGEQIAGIVIGPYDLSVQVGTPLDINSTAALAQIRKTIEICAASNKSVGIFCDSLAVARKWHEEGMNILWVSTDVALLNLGISQALQRIKTF